MPDPDQTPNNINFEQAFARLEQILATLNSDGVSLDDSLKLYEEADRLIRLCGQQLNSAERKIELLIKNRSGELQRDERGELLKDEFQRPQH